MLFIAIAIRLDSPGSVIFSQQRLGQHGRRFKMHKFRKFPDNWGSKGPGVTMQGDARMTKVGRFLEKTKLDELPQLWNILRGEMSFVGPRPECERYADLFTGEYSAVLNYRPGIFGPNQITFRNEAEVYPIDQNPETYYRMVLFPKKARADLAFFETANCLDYLKCIIQGLWVSMYGVVNWRRVFSLHGKILLADLLVIEIAWSLAYLLRWSDNLFGRHWDSFITGLWLFPLILIPGMFVGGCYRHPVRFFSLNDAVRLFIVVSSAWVFAYLVFLGLLHRDASIMLVPLGMLVLIPLLNIPRIIHRVRWLRVNKTGRHDFVKTHVAVYGTDLRAIGLAALLDQGFKQTRIVGFIAVNQILTGRFLLGYKVLGVERDLSTIHAVHHIDQLWVAFIPDKIKYNRIKTWCNENHVIMVVLPEIEPFAFLANPVIASVEQPANQSVIYSAVTKM